MELAEQIQKLRQTLSDAEIIKQLNISNYTFYETVKIYNIPKISTSERNLNIAKAKISKDDLYEYYIEQNHSLHETEVYFNERALLRKLINEYGLKKDTKRHVENIKKSKQQRYGD